MKNLHMQVQSLWQALLRGRKNLLSYIGREVGGLEIQARLHLTPRSRTGGQQVSTISSRWAAIGKTIDAMAPDARY